MEEKYIFDNIPNVDFYNDYGCEELAEIEEKVSQIKMKGRKVKCKECKGTGGYNSCCQKTYSKFCCGDYSDFSKCELCEGGTIDLDSIIISYIKNYKVIINYNEDHKVI